MPPRYREALREPHVTRLLVSSMIARLPQGMSNLAVLLLLTPRFGYGRAGLASGIATAGCGVSNVLLARAADRVGPRTALLPAAIGYAAAMGALAAVAGGSYGLLAGIAAVIGLTTPPITAVSRGLWPRLLGPDRIQVLYGLEATLQELVFIAGPAAVALIAGLASPRTAVVATGVAGLAGALWYVAAPPLARPPRAERVARERGLLHTGVAWYAAVGLCLVFGFSMTEIATVAFVGGRHATAASGVVLAVWSAGSLAGGLRFGAGSARVTDRALGILVVVTAAGAAVAALASGTVTLALILFLGGAAIAPTMARLYTRMGDAAPPRAATEAFGWLAVGFQVGAAGGAAVGGAVVDLTGARAALALAGAAVLLGLLAVARAHRVMGAQRPVAS